MAWPNAADYNDAIQNPDLCFADADLIQCVPRRSKLGLPSPSSGNFAAVYELRCPKSRRSWGVKCFTREVDGLRQRYLAISAAVRASGLPVFTEFEFVEKGIRVRGGWYPILKMAWVEGRAFDACVTQSLDSPATLAAMADDWAEFSSKLSLSGIAHGDLQHGNVLLIQNWVKPSLAFRLVDYDGMHVPGLPGGSSESGHPNYQHPERLRKGTHNKNIDRFSQLVIYTALQSLRRGGRALWDRYDNGENLLFCRRDFEEPHSSKLFRELWRAGGAERGLVGRLVLACVERVEDVPSLATLLANEALPTLTSDEEKRVVEVLHREISPTPTAIPLVEWWKTGSEEFFAMGRPSPPPGRLKTPPIVKWWENAQGVDSSPP